ncbi:hypothetical protein [Corynebacterium gerontici]|uniref:LemA family protein n=1 Tax=Corynebacterium gerontici TaxID=2079234 RepID=A0A3G6J6B4_9CORY|nr:hypothetical protein [Corynebacterium gerontici]AZA11554.1 hypothetical protein CGERO_06235 [Corynebacterium gerontici]
MHTALVVLLTVAISAAVLWAYFTAQRLHRLHIRTDAALASLQSALDRRAAIAAVMLPDLTRAASEAQAVPLVYATFAQRIEKERAISAGIAELGSDVPLPLADAQVRLQLAHRFYNDAVADTRALRMRPLIRLTRLGGAAALPEFFEYSEL